MITAEQDKKNWDWLPHPYDARIKKIREKVEALWVAHEHAPQLPYFTPHGKKHSQSVEDLIHRLIPDEECFRKLTERERFYLLASAWVHDIGMVVGIEGEHDVHASPEDIRSAHHTRSEDYIVNHCASIGVEAEDASALSLLARYHGEDLDECPPDFAAGNNEVVRLRLLTAYLRLADALDISQSRSPMTDYAICLAYNIPMSSKLHWIKSRLINGIHISPVDHRITVHFKTLHDDPQDPALAVQKQNLEKLQRLVMDELRASVDSNMPTLVRGGISYFIDLDHRSMPMVIDEQVRPELIRLVSNFDMMVEPSATKLMHMLLQTVRYIIGTPDGPEEDEDHHRRRDRVRPSQRRLKQELTEFMQQIRSQILANRPCHLGLKELIDCLDDDIQKLNIDPLRKRVDRYLKRIEDERENVRASARDYFRTGQGGAISNSKIERFVQRVRDALGARSPRRLLSLRLGEEMADEDYINIMVYGLSELVIKALCGFRDYVVEELLRNDEIVRKLQIHKDNLETIASTLLRIFVCEGQPKTITAKNDRLAYHDGTRYALDLNRRGFNNVMILPDLVAGSLGRGLLDFVMFGVNGLEYDPNATPASAHFYHTSGHLAIAVLAKYLRQKGGGKQGLPEDRPRLILVLSKSKCAKIGNRPSEDDTPDGSTKKAPTTIENEGFKFWVRRDSRVRTQPFLIRDEDIRAELYRAGIRLYNPKEDSVELGMVDDIIADEGCFPEAGREGWEDFRIWLSPETPTSDVQEEEAHGRHTGRRNANRQSAARH